MVLDTADLEKYHSGQSAAHASNDVSGGSGASGGKPLVLCGVCREVEAVRSGRCWPCYLWMRRHQDEDGNHYEEHGMDRDVRRSKPAVTPLDRTEVDVATLTYAEWCKAAGYDPATRQYR